MKRRGPDAELDAGARAHYEDVGYYTNTYATREDDVAYYVELAIGHGCPLLEYGCGNGRITIPTARAGLDILGVDQAAPMLKDLKRRLQSEDPGVQQRVRTRRGDMRSVKINETFGLVTCTFNTFLHLYDRPSVERYLARVHQHLKPTGRFVFDVSLPDPEELARDPKRAYGTPRFRHATTGQVVRYGERFDYDDMRQVLFVAMEFEPRDAPDEKWMTPLAHRQFFPQELEALLHYNGFAIEAIDADFQELPPTNDSAALIYHCKARRGWR